MSPSLTLAALAVLLTLAAARILPAARSPGALRMGFSAALAGIGAGLVLLLLGASQLASAVLPTWATGFGIAALSLLAATQVWGWLKGIALVLSGRVRIGDRVLVGDKAGALSRAGLLRAELNADDGQVWSVPWTSVGREVLGLSPHGTPLPVTIVLRGLPEIVADSRRRVARAAALCPFRVWTRPVEVHLDPLQETVEVRVWTWAPDAVPLAEDFLREATRRALEGG
ncbi:MAG: mechanosensitive ion channel domain-containing protein [Myxococcota bacterium]